MGIVELAGLLVTAAPAILKLGDGAWASYKRIVAALKLKADTPEEKAALDRVETRMHQLDIEVANAPEPA